MKTPILETDFAPPIRLGGLEDSFRRGMERTNIDQSDGDDEYFEVCAEIYGGRYVKVFSPRPTGWTK